MARAAPVEAVDAPRREREHSLVSASCCGAKAAQLGSARYVSSSRSCSIAAAPENMPLLLPFAFVGSCSRSYPASASRAPPHNLGSFQNTTAVDALTAPRKRDKRILNVEETNSFLNS